MTDFKYRAFISYSHADHDWGVWLHKELEKFKTPKQLVGRETAAGAVPKRLGRVYRDEAEEGAAHDLGERIERALASSDALVVICSRASAKSEWVNQEIVRLKQLGREHRIFAVIVDGEPHAADPTEECFPDALKFELGPDGALSDEPADPLAVDIRKFGRDDTVLRLASGILDVDYDALKQRDLIRRRQELRRAQALFAGAALLFIGAGVSVALSVIQTWNVNTQRSMLFAEKAKRFNDEYDHLHGLLWALGGLPHESQLIKGDYAEARAQFVRSYRESVVLVGHKGEIRFASFSPNGWRVVTASWDKTARVWDAEKGEELAVLAGHNDGVWSASFSPDGRRIVTASLDKTARVWDSETGEERVVLRHENVVRSASFSPDGRRIVTASWDKTAKLWDAGTGAEIATFAAHNLLVFSASFSPPDDNGKSARIVTASGDGTAKLWDAASGAELMTLAGHGGAVYSAVFSPDGARIVTASNDNTARVWNVETGAELAVLAGHEGEVLSAAFSPYGRRVVTASWDKTARIWDSEMGEKVALLGGHKDPVNYASFSPDGHRIVTASWDFAAKLWDAGTAAEIATLAGHNDNVNSALFSPDGRRVVTTSDDGTARIWDAMSEASSWSLSDMRAHGCEQIVRQDLSEFDEASPVLAGGAADGSDLKNPCEKRGLKSWGWWRPKFEQAYAALRKRLPFLRAGSQPQTDEDASEPDESSSEL